MGVGDDDCGGCVTRGGSQPDNVPECIADRLEVHVDGGCGCAPRYSRQLSTQRRTYEFAHTLSGEFRLGEEIAELCQRALPNVTLVRYCFGVVAQKQNGRTYLGRHIATWNYTRLEKRAARLIGVGD